MTKCMGLINALSTSSHPRWARWAQALPQTQMALRRYALAAYAYRLNLHACNVQLMVFQVCQGVLEASHCLPIISISVSCMTV